MLLLSPSLSDIVVFVLEVEEDKREGAETDDRPEVIAIVAGCRGMAEGRDDPEEMKSTRPRPCIASTYTGRESRSYV